MTTGPRRRATILCLALLTPPASALAVEVETAAAPCSFRVWSKDPDPAGLNVRAAPRRDAAVIARLPPPRGADEDRMAVEMTVIGGRDGWFLISGAGWGDYEGTGERPVFEGRGWVSGAMIDTQVQDEAVRAAPAADARVLDAPHETPLGREYLKTGRFLACAGGWVEIEGAFVRGEGEAGRRVRGWVTDLCGNQVTTCP